LDMPFDAFLQTIPFYLPPILYGLNIVCLLFVVWRRRVGTKWARRMFVQFLAVLFYAQVLVRSDVHHLLITLPPFFVVGAWSLNSLFSYPASKLKGFAAIPAKHSIVEYSVLAMTLLVCFVVIPMAHSAMLRDPQSASTMLTAPRGGIRVDQVTGDVLNDLVRIIQTHAKPQQSVLCLPYSPMFYFLADRRNPTSWNYLHPGDQSEEDHRNLVEQAKLDPPEVITVMGEDGFGKYAGTILDYVRTNYQLQYYSGVLDANVYIPVVREESRD